MFPRGLLIRFPVKESAASPDNSSEPAPSLRRALPAALVLSIGLTLSVAVFLLVRRWDTDRVKRAFEWRSQSAAGDLREAVTRSEDCLYTLRDLYDASENVTAEEFRLTAENLRGRHRGIQILTYVAATSADTQEIAYIEPPTGSDRAAGFNHATGPDAAVLMEAAGSGKPRATPRFALSGSANFQFGWEVFLPLYQPGPPPQTEADRRARLRGFVSGTFRLTDLIWGMTHENPSRTLEALITDESPGVRDPFLVALIAERILTGPPPVAAEFASGLNLALPLAVGGREWRVRFRPAPAWLAGQSTSYAYGFLAAGVLLTGVVTSALLNAQRQQAVIEKLVAQRTGELHAAQEELREDIRQRDVAEQALRASEERYRAFVEQSTEAIWRFEVEPPIPTDLPVAEQVEAYLRNATLAECNDVMAQMYGYVRSKEFVGTPLSELLPLDDPRNLDHVRAFIENRYRVTDEETHEVDRNGHPKSFLNNLTGIVEDHLLRRVWGTQRDITERKHAEDARREQELRLRLAVAASGLGTWEWDIRTDRMAWSPETEAMFGLPSGTFDGNPETFFSFAHPEDAGIVRSTLGDAIKTPGPATVPDQPRRFVRRDGTLRWLVARGLTLRDAAGNPLRMIGAVLDVTAQRQAEEERTLIERKLQETQKLESLGVLAGGIAHDFNNLLTGVLGNASIARVEIPRDSPTQECLAQIEEAAQRAAELCKQMLAYSGRGRFIVRPLDLSAVVRETTELIHTSIGKKASIRFSLATDLPAINADATQVRQIVMNLVINASDAIGENSGVIAVSTGVMHADRACLADTYLSPGIPEGRYVFLEVSDDGEGMSAATKAKIFEPFFTTKFTGRGLGLAAVLGIVRGHRGAMKIHSELGRGTTFRLLLPCTDGTADAGAAAGDAGAAWRGSGTVLVVDDEETVRGVASRMLKMMGFEPLLACDGREAVEIFAARSGEIAGVMLDLTMPSLDGAATLAELRRVRPDVRVLLMSGFTEHDALNRFGGKGLSCFLQKPFRAEDLRTALRGMFESPAQG